MKTNDLKKGDLVTLRNGWEARIEDNMKGNTRLATVYGDYTDIGSVYSHDIMEVKIMRAEGSVLRYEKIEHTPSQLKCREMDKALW